ncbi:family 43 glycosylhydrolase [Paenibacillus sp. FSL R10-2796]|uniref:glycoside hydrolase family 43 protein n=1 Tax=Paenibacillus sp. FSL R10-2796 TaxID=2954663 RepID=UPI0030D9A98C
MKYNNPIIPGFYPDPSICRVDEDYYLVNSSFAYSPGIPIWHSKDLVHWKQLGYCLTRENQLQFDESVVSGGVWAPTLRYYNGRFYMVTTNQDSGGKFPEGPHLYKINDYYYLMCAEGGTEYGHMETIARSRSPYGPYESSPHNPILTHRSSDYPIQATGHADLVEAQDGSWWAVFLGIRPVGYPYRHHLGRETYLAPVQWTEEGWPMIGDNGVVGLEMEADLPSPMPWEEEPETDDFDQSDLRMSWNFIRNANKVDWSLQERGGWLALRGSDVRLNEKGTPAFIGCRQRHLNCGITTKMEFSPLESDEAGLVVFMDQKYHYAIGLTQMEDKNVIALRRQVGSISDVAYSSAFEGTGVELRIQALPEKYIFYYRGVDQIWHLLGEAETHLISTEVAGGFTGVFFGMYNYSPYGTTAYYDWFSYQKK